MRDIAAKVEGCNGASSSKVIEALNKNNSFNADAPPGCTNSYLYLLPPIYLLTYIFIYLLPNIYHNCLLPPIYNCKRGILGYIHWWGKDCQEGLKFGPNPLHLPVIADICR